MRIIFLVFLLAAAMFAQAQDRLHKLNDSWLEVTVLEVTDTHIRYRLHAQPEGPVYVIAKDDVIRIVFESGEEEIIPKSVKIQPARAHRKRPEYDDRTTGFGRNIISLNTPDLLAELVTVNYERFFSSGRFSIKVPVSAGFGSREVVKHKNEKIGGYYNRGKIYSTGLDFYFYPSGQGKARFFLGPSLEYGKLRPVLQSFNPDLYRTEKHSYSGSFHSFLFQTGYLFQPSKHFTVAMAVGCGYSKVNLDFPNNTTYGNNYYGAGGRPALRGALNAGYRF